ncbi:V-type ATP synthase subunit A [Candidatus Dependentiae bacterium]|nr:V-type ATP synthase subunit A [Candidatus Dependentiae bacterium]
MQTPNGKIIYVNGPVVKLDNAVNVKMFELIQAGNLKLTGEVIELNNNIATIQVYEDTCGLKPGEPYYRTNFPLYAELGPGLVGNMYDGILRPLKKLEQISGQFLTRGVSSTTLDRKKKWEVRILKIKGDIVKSGDIVAEIQETSMIVHKILVPIGISGEIIENIPNGVYNIETVIFRVKTSNGIKEIKMFQNWPIRISRPVQQRLLPAEPLITGQRVIDTFFPLAKGGTAAIPGGFGTGKTMTQHQLAKWSAADLIVYVGCGERGNEMTEVLEDFPKIIDPRSGQLLMERTILIANTSNMPVAAREASIYTGITLGEYFRDMGYNVAIMADSTSRWAEALREISGRLEEIPAEEGYPAYLGSRVAEFYERAGYVQNFNKTNGSISVIGAVSPPGGDFSEPVTQNTKRFIRCFWGLDRNLANARHYPAINWLESYSEYYNEMSEYWEKNVSPDWMQIVNKTMEIMQIENELSQIVKLVGDDVLADNQKLIIFFARLIKTGFLQQGAYDEVDTYCSMEKQYKMLKLYHHYYDVLKELNIKGVSFDLLKKLKINDVLFKLKSTVKNNELYLIDEVWKKFDDEISNMKW